MITLTRSHNKISTIKNAQKTPIVHAAARGHVGICSPVVYVSTGGEFDIHGSTAGGIHDPDCHWLLWTKKIILQWLSMTADS